MTARQPLHLGLTGGIGSGKSTVAGLLARHGAAIIDADAISRATTTAGGPALPAIAATFGAALIGADGALDRTAMRAQVYGNPQARQRLEAIGAKHSKIKSAAGRSAQTLLMPGTTLIREWDEREYRVTVTPDGLYELNGQVFKSLSAAARHITGTRWNGPKFFGLRGGKGDAQ